MISGGSRDDVRSFIIITIFILTILVLTYYFLIPEVFASGYSDGGWVKGLTVIVLYEAIINILPMEMYFGYWNQVKLYQPSNEVKFQLILTSIVITSVVVAIINIVLTRTGVFTLTTIQFIGVYIKTVPTRLIIYKLYSDL